MHRTLLVHHSYRNPNSEPQTHIALSYSNSPSIPIRFSSQSIQSLPSPLFSGICLPVEDMSPASRSKSKDKKASNEPQKVASRPPMAAAATGNGVPASAYNPHWGTFHTLEAGPTLSVSPLQLNGRFRSMDETDEHHNGGTHGNGVEYDSISNNSSWSGESEEHKEKSSNTPVRPQTTAPVVDNDKREKIRQKNEKKHQRQKEKRAQELHDRCCGYLMSRKLEALAQQLVAMGFSHERATMALMMNEGRVEESVAWLFEAGEDDDSNRDPNLCGANLKIDISEELAQLTDMESKFKLSKQEVERAVVSCEGDLENAAETLRKMKQDLPPGPSKPGETGDPPLVAAAQNSMKPLPKPNPSSTLQQRTDEKKASAMVGESLEHGLKNVQVMKRAQPKLEWAKSQPTTVPSDKRWTTAPSSYSLASSLQASHPPTKVDNRYVSVGNEFRNPLQGSVTEPVMMMQRPQSSNGKQIPVSSSAAFTAATVTTNWNPTTNGFDTGRSSGVSSGFGGSNQFYPVQYQHQYGLGTSPGEANWGIQQQQQYGHGSGMSGMGDFYGSSRGWSNRGGTTGTAGVTITPTLAAASSLGLFSGLGSTSGPSSPIDWNNGSSSMDIDYSNIDWSLDRGGGSLTNPNNKSSNLMLGLASVMNNSGLYDLDAPELGLGTHHQAAAMRGVVPMNGKGGRSFQDGVVVGSEGGSGSGAREWTSPFEGNDIFSLPRQFVSSPFSVD